MHTLCLRRTTDNPCVGSNGGLNWNIKETSSIISITMTWKCGLKISAFCQVGITFWVYKLDNYVILENVDFLNCWNSIYPYSLQGALKPFVICGSCLVDSLLLSVIRSKQYNVLVWEKKNYIKKKSTYETNQCILSPKKMYCHIQQQSLVPKPHPPIHW